MADDVGQDLRLGRVVGARQLLGDVVDGARAVAQLQHGDGDGVGREHALGRQDRPAIARWSWRSLMCRGSAGFEAGSDQHAPDLPARSWLPGRNAPGGIRPGVT